MKDFTEEIKEWEKVSRNMTAQKVSDNQWVICTKEENKTIAIVNFSEFTCLVTDIRNYPRFTTLGYDFFYSFGIDDPEIKILCFDYNLNDVLPMN